MNSAAFLQICLLLGVFVPLASFVFLAFFGTKLGKRRDATDARIGHDEHRAAPANGEPVASWIATGAIATSLVLAFIVLFIWAGAKKETRPEWTAAAADNAVLWAELGVGPTAVPIHFGVKLDSLTIIMFLMVTLTSTCIHVFSIGYMKGDPRFARFFAFLSLFCFSMLGLLISSNLIFLFIFWELVGVCSYFLIGFWFERKSASNAAIKAFVVNRIGDFGFMIGLMLCFTYLGDLSLDGAAATFEAAAHHAGWAQGEMSAAAAAVPASRVEKAAELFSTSGLGVMLATWMGICLFCGAIGKSAQFPLQVWLPDAMEGPTPVSALIHAATMVAAGVYLVARIFTLLTPSAQLFIAVIGCITLTMAALIAIVQVDIKRVLAYSTLSQLGYMVFAIGVGAWIAALFHLLTHAFFKSLLFLGSGQVIAGCHHEQDMRRMGGLIRKMPRTGWTFLIAVLAISGAGIPLTQIGIGGFYSKDEILAVAYYRTHNWTDEAAAHASLSNGGRVVLVGTQALSAEQAPTERTEPTLASQYPAVDPLPWILWFLPIVVAYITPFYMGRCFMLTFMGKPRDKHVYEHAHESSLMYQPLLILAAMTLISGVLVFRDQVAYAAPKSLPLVPAIDGGHGTMVHHAVQTPLALSVGFAFVVGLGLAWWMYRDGLKIAERVRRLPVLRVFYQILWHKFYFDEIYNFVLVGGTKLVAIICGLFDNWIIDGIVNNGAYATERIARFSGVVLDGMGVDGLVNLVGRTGWALGGVFRALQTGVVRNYVLLTALAVTGLIVSLWDVKIALVLVVLTAGVLILRRSESASSAARVEERRFASERR